MDAVTKLFEEYSGRRGQIEISVEKMKKDLGELACRIVLYGAGSAGIAFLLYLRDAGIKPLYFADGDERRWGAECGGLEILPPREIITRAGKDALVIVTINTDGKRYCKSFQEALRKGGHTGVHKMLEALGCKNHIDYTYFRRVHALYQGDRYNLPSCSDISAMEAHIPDLCEVFHMLEDDLSRETFLKIIRFRLIDDSISIPTLDQEKQYFEYNLFPRDKKEIFVDCGAFNGISAKIFFQENKAGFAGYYGFEPDEANFQLLSRYADSLPDAIKGKLVIQKKAVYDRDGEVSLYSLEGPGSFVSDIGQAAVPAVKIDTALEGRKATFIKMNIEGSELPALRGASETIRFCRPRLAIAGYHKTWDLWEIPQLIKRMHGGYRIYLRSYMNHISFIYYCV